LGITGVPRGPPVNAGAAPVGILRYVRAPHSVCATPRQNRRHRNHDPPSVIARGRLAIGSSMSSAAHRSKWPDTQSANAVFLAIVEQPNEAGSSVDRIGPLIAAS